MFIALDCDAHSLESVQLQCNIFRVCAKWWHPFRFKVYVPISVPSRSSRPWYALLLPHPHRARAHPLFSSFSRWFIRQTIRNFSWIFFMTFFVAVSPTEFNFTFVYEHVNFLPILFDCCLCMCVCEPSHTRAHFYTINDDNDFHFWRIFALTRCSECAERLRSYVMWCDKNGTPRGISRNSLDVSESVRGDGNRLAGVCHLMLSTKFYFILRLPLYSAFDLKCFNNSRHSREQTA